MLNVQNLIDFIKDRSISDILRNYIQLNKSGNIYKSLCPFHHDKNPSLHVSDHKGLFKCFVCNTGGDAITFVQQYRSLNFIEALTEISKIYNLDFSVDPQSKDSNNKKLALTILENTFLYYENYTRKFGREILKKFLQKRHLSENTANIFKLCISPKNGGLLQFLYSKKICNEKDLLSTCLTLGILKKSDKNQRLYEPFQQRVIFPIEDRFGQIVGFGSRALHDFQKAKYYNSSESFIFKKRNLLYGLNITEKEIKNSKSIILVEGYMDVLSLFDKGVKNCVAILGTGPGPEINKKIKQLSENIYLGLDSDSAGIAASKKINNELFKDNIIPKILNFAPYNDPDEYILNEGHRNFTNLLKNSKNILDSEINKIKSKPVLDVEKKVEVLNDFFEICSPLKKNIFAVEKISELGEVLQLSSSKDVLHKSYDRYLNRLIKINASQLRGNSQKIPRKKAIIQRVPPIERNLITICVNHPNILESSSLKRVLNLLSSIEVKKAICYLINLYSEIDEEEYSNILLKQLHTAPFNAEIKGLLSSAMYSKSSSIEKKVEVKLVQDIEKKLKLKELIHKKNILLEQLSTKDEMGEESLKKLHMVEQEIYQIKKV